MWPGHCWVGESANFHLTIRYQQGKSDTNADALSISIQFQNDLKEYTEKNAPSPSCYLCHLTEGQSSERQLCAFGGCIATASWYRMNPFMMASQ